jgi:hypothetical protein
VAPADNFLEQQKLQNGVPKRSAANQPRRAALVTQISGVL